MFVKSLINAILPIFGFNKPCCTISEAATEALTRTTPVTKHVLYGEPKIKQAYEVGSIMYNGQYSKEQAIASTGSEERYNAYKKLYNAVKPLYELHLKQESIFEVLKNCSLSTNISQEECYNAIDFCNSNIDIHNILYAHLSQVIGEVKVIIDAHHCELGYQDHC